MKLAGREAAAFCRAPDQGIAGVLLHGPDEGMIAARRRELVEAILGARPDPLRLTQLDPTAVRRDPAALEAALRGRGLFAGRGIVVVEGATESLAAPIGDVAENAAPDDPLLVVTAASLPARSGLRRLFEGGRRLVSLQVAPETLGPAEIGARLRALGASEMEDEAGVLLATLAGGMSHAAFDRFIEVVALSTLGLERPVTAAAVSALAPAGLDAEIDAFIEAVAGGHPERVCPLLRRVTATGAAPVSLLIGLQRHFRQLLLVASADGGVEAGLAQIRPPLWGARRDAMRAVLRLWRRERLELAARLLFEIDARVRSAERVPAMALVERCALRLSMMAGR